MPSPNYHTAIIGAGSAGLTVAVGLSGLGKKVALIESQHVGGDCTNVGCIPSKTLIHKAKHLMANGLTPTQVLSHVREKRNHLRDEELEWVKGIKNLSYLEGQASFVNPHELQLQGLDGQSFSITAKNIVIASGAKPIIIPIEGLNAERLLTNENLFEQATLPKHIAILGAGIIGLEMAFALKNLGIEISLIDLAARVMTTASEKASAVMYDALLSKGIKLYLTTKVQHYDETEESLYLENGNLIAGVEKVLMAIGRQPNLKPLALEQAGVNYDRRGIPTNAYAQTNVKGIYAIGDVTPQSKFTHSANAQGRRLVSRIAFPFLPRLQPEPPYPSASFTEPEVAQVGPSLEKLSSLYHPELIKSYHFELSKTDRGYTEGITGGFITLHVMRLTGSILAAEIVAPKASEMLPLLTLAIYQNISLYKMSQMIFPYPTFSEAIRKMADQFVFATLPKLPQELMAYLRYRWQKPVAK